ncbi:MAG: hypothetical protein IPH12_12825 [Saprospirales bacterium]|nr:hypothetical protein [Saprospirales bacterium]
MYKRLFILFLWLGASILATYYAPAIFRPIFYVIMLGAYFRSKDEALWLTLFFIVSDGFWGYFNAYEVVVSLIPGLPPIEVGHLYILLTVIKASKAGNPGRFFHDKIVAVMAVYLGFLIVQGYVLGLSPQINIQFRMVKFIFPIMLFYSVPRLFRTGEQYRDLFMYMFPFAFFALFAQVFTIVTHMSPSQYLGIYRDFWFTVDVSKGKTYRGFYSSGIVLMTFFGALYYLAHRGKNFNFLYLVAIAGADLMSVFLSATRGWLIGLSLGLVLFLLFIFKPSGKRLATMAGATIVLILGLLAIPVVGMQFTHAFKRMTTLEALASGDVTAHGTLERLNKRSPRVMGKWIETPLTGWGFSDEFFKYADFHVANQNILLHSGILGAILMGMFFVYFHFVLFWRSTHLPRGHPLKEAIMVFVIFFPGWFFIHSTSGQHFGYYQEPATP